MRNLQDHFRHKVAEVISERIEQSYLLKLDVNSLQADLALVPNLKMGHVAFPCFKLAKELKKNPKEVAEKLQADWTSREEVNNSEEANICSDVKAAGPFLNLFFKSEFFGESVLVPMISEEYFSIKENTDAPYLIEYSQPNTHKELHVGHMRNLCYGQALVLLFQYLGNNVVTCTFPGDVGTHVAKCLWFLKYHNTENVPTEKKGEWLGKMYSAAHNKLEDEIGSDKEEGNRQQLTEILVELEKEEGEFYDLWKETRQWSIDLMNSVYQWAGVSFDRWFWESEVDSSSLKLVKNLQSEGKLVESEGAIGFDLSEEKLGFCMLLKSDGNGLYATKDLDLMRLKFEEYNPQKNIYIVDVRQELHFKQVMAVYEKLGFGDASQSLHLKYNFVELPDGAMSSRKGNIIPINDLIKNMGELIKSEHLIRYKGEWSDDEIEKTAAAVAEGAIKYGMNRMDSNKKIVFDMKEWLKLDGESGPYIQYSHARICSIIKKQSLSTKAEENINWNLLVHPSEVELMIKLSQFNWSMFKTLEKYKTSGVCSYLYELAKLFSAFYHDCSIARAESEELKSARLALASAVKSALEKGLGILGISAPERM